MNDRSPALGFLTFGKEFADAAAALHKLDPKSVDAPVYYLYAHAIELELKAYLRAKDFSLQQLKQLGHDLEAILAACEEQGLSALAPLAAEQKAALSLINTYYREKELEYIVTGSKHFPPLHCLATVATALYDGLDQVCYRHSFPRHA